VIFHTKIFFKQYPAWYHWCGQDFVWGRGFYREVNKMWRFCCVAQHFLHKFRHQFCLLPHSEGRGRGSVSPLPTPLHGIPYVNIYHGNIYSTGITWQKSDLVDARARRVVKATLWLDVLAKSKDLYTYGIVWYSIAEHCIWCWCFGEILNSPNLPNILPKHSAKCCRLAELVPYSQNYYLRNYIYHAL